MMNPLAAAASTPLPDQWREVLSSEDVRALSDRAFRLYILAIAKVDTSQVRSIASAKKELVRAGIAFDLDTSPTQLDLSNERTRQKKRLPIEWLARFDRFWSAFDYKKGRVGALTAWYRLESEALKAPIDFERVIESAKIAAFVALQDPRRTRQMAEGWLNDRRFDDEVSACYSKDELRLLQIFGERCPGADPASEFTLSRQRVLSNALKLRPIESWEAYFHFVHDHPDVLGNLQRPISIQSVLSAEVFARVRERRDRLHGKPPTKAEAVVHG